METSDQLSLGTLWCVQCGANADHGGPRLCLLGMSVRHVSRLVFKKFEVRIQYVANLILRLCLNKMKLFTCKPEGTINCETLPKGPT